MKILWFTNTSSLYSSGKHHYYGGGWIESLEALLREQPDIELAVSFFHSTENGKVEKNGNVYYPIKITSGRKNPVRAVINNLIGKIENSNKYIPRLLEVIHNFEPDIIHIFGTEGIFASIQSHTKIPIVIHLQGLINPYQNTYFPPGQNRYDFLRSSSYIFKNLIGTSPFFSHKRFVSQAKREIEHFKNSSSVMGRTAWDKEVSRLLAPQANYFHVDEVLRSLFYENKKEYYQKRQQIKIFSTLSSTAYKGLDVVLKTARLLSESSNITFEWNIAGLNETDPLLKHFEKVFKLSHKRHKIKCVGKLVPMQLIDFLKDSDIFIHPSYIDNSPNSVCEAQILGLPVVACDVGGLSTLITHGETGMLVPSNGIYELASILKDYNINPDKYFKLGENARVQALNRHNRKKIMNQLLHVYKKITSSEFLQI